MLRKEKGFTLIELLIVIAIIGILAAIAIPMYKTQTIKAKMTEVTNAMSNVASAVAAYYQETNSFPTAPDVATIRASLGVALANVQAKGQWLGIRQARILGLGFIGLCKPPDLRRVQERDAPACFRGCCLARRSTDVASRRPRNLSLLAARAARRPAALRQRRDNRLAGHTIACPTRACIAAPAARDPGPSGQTSSHTRATGRGDTPR